MAITYLRLGLKRRHGAVHSLSGTLELSRVGLRVVEDASNKSSNADQS